MSRLAVLHRERAALYAKLAELEAEIAAEFEKPPPTRPERIELIARGVRDAKDIVRRDPTKGVSRVYFVHAGGCGPIKIGFTVDLAGRVAALQTSSPVELRMLGCVPGGMEREAEIHREFSDVRLHGEWFRPSPELLAFISEVLR